jgi:hypothetical protein
MNITDKITPARLRVPERVQGYKPPSEAVSWAAGICLFMVFVAILLDDTKALSRVLPATGLVIFILVAHVLARYRFYQAIDSGYIGPGIAVDKDKYGWVEAAVDTETQIGVEYLSNGMYVDNLGNSYRAPFWGDALNQAITFIELGDGRAQAAAKSAPPPEPAPAKEYEAVLYFGARWTPDCREEASSIPAEVKDSVKPQDVFPTLMRWATSPEAGNVFPLSNGSLLYRPSITNIRFWVREKK